MQHNIRVSKKFLQSIIDKVEELQGKESDPVIIIIDNNDVLHYQVYPNDNGVDAPQTPSITSMKVKHDIGFMCDEINIDAMGYVEPQPTDNIQH